MSLVNQTATPFVDADGSAEAAVATMVDHAESGPVRADTIRAGITETSRNEVGSGDSDALVHPQSLVDDTLLGAPDPRGHAVIALLASTDAALLTGVSTVGGGDTAE